MRRHRWFPLLVLTAGLVIGCADGGGADCEQLAARKLELAIAATPQAMQDRARARFSDRVDEIERACERAAPSGDVARCQLAAPDLVTFERCAAD